MARKAVSVALIAGDSTGREMMREVKRVIEWFRANRDLDTALSEPAYGLAALAQSGSLLSSEDMALLAETDVIVFGAAGGPEYDPQYDHLPRAVRRTGSALRLRRELGLFANLRPIRTMPASFSASPLKPAVIEGVDLLIVRELLGGLYFGEPRGVEVMADGDRRGVNTHVYLASQVRRIARLAFEFARQRRRKVCSVEKAAVMEAGQMWREEVIAVHADFPDVALEHMAVDTCAQMIIKNPRQFDVILTDNVFGDILSDCASMIVGSVGLQASACFGSRRADGRRAALYEPLDANDFHLAGKDLCNPVGAILSFALALEHSMGRPQDAAMLTAATEAALERGLRTQDLALESELPAKTSEVGDAILAELALRRTPAAQH